mmetsp:Transcript_12182/g.35666  ORF Transcript_12182/g.35666 Transcript_12182/m.35666 type:complete len:168 (-) Transcript_12182:722-1225(-)
MPLAEEKKRGMPSAGKWAEEVDHNASKSWVVLVEPAAADIGAVVVVGTPGAVAVVGTPAPSSVASLDAQGRARQLEEEEGTVLARWEACGAARCSILSLSMVPGLRRAGAWHRSWAPCQGWTPSAREFPSLASGGFCEPRRACHREIIHDNNHRGRGQPSGAKSRTN